MEEHMGQMEKLREMVNNSDNIVFFGGAGFPRKAGFPISEVWTDFTTRNTIIRRKLF